MTDTASHTSTPLSDAEAQVRLRLTNAMRASRDILRTYESVSAESSPKELMDAMTTLNLFESILDEVDELVEALRSIRDVTIDGNRIIGATEATMLILRMAQAEMVAQIDSATE